MHSFTSILLAHSWLALMVSLSLAQYPPVQQQCLGRQAVQYQPEIVEQLRDRPKWFVARVSILTQLPYDIPKPDTNSCAPLSYLQDCWSGAIHIVRNFAEDGSISQLTSAFNQQDQTIVNYFEERTWDDPNFFIFSGSVNLMRFYRLVWPRQVEKFLEINDNFPEFVTYTEGSQYAMLGFNAAGGIIRWVLYADCQRELAWIEVNRWAMENNAIDQVNGEVDDFLQQPANMNIPPMVAISQDLPFTTPDQM